MLGKNGGRGWRRLSESRGRVGLLTGTFDPVHLGHVELARAAKRECGLDEVWWLVNARPVGKHGVTDYGLRVRMTELALQGEAGMWVYGGVGHDGPHTMQAFNEITGGYPETEFVFIVGMDTLARLDRWPDVESVVKDATYAVAHRSGAPVAVDGLRSRLGELGDELKVRLFELDDHTGAASSVIRQQLRAGERSSMLDERVHEYVLANGLYGAGL
jgi:nicotinate-nucleotide adenylyltransferase